MARTTLTTADIQTLLNKRVVADDGLGKSTKGEITNINLGSCGIEGDIVLLITTNAGNGIPLYFSLKNTEIISRTTTELKVNLERDQSSWKEFSVEL